MTPLVEHFLPLSEKELFPSPTELSARCRTPIGEIPPETKELFYEILSVATPAAVFSVWERSFDLTELLSLRGEASLLGDRVALFAVTLGYGVDRLLEREQRRSLERAYLLDAVASAMVEAGADAAERAIRDGFPEIRFGRRYSPGYGKLPLSANTPLLSLLGADRRLGIRQSESLLMHPSKTVTAILGGSHDI